MNFEMPNDLQFKTEGVLPYTTLNEKDSYVIKKRHFEGFDG
jgi:hypothetical protein